jgi:hypothetical protein
MGVLWRLQRGATARSAKGWLTGDAMLLWVAAEDAEIIAAQVHDIVTEHTVPRRSERFED